MISKTSVIVLATLFCSYSTFSQGVKTKKYPRIDFTKVGDSEFDTLLFSGRVKLIYKCPPCPEGAQCKPCLGDHVEVTNNNPDDSFRVFTHQLSLFEIDKTYDFLIRFRGALHRKDNIELVTATVKK